MGRGRRYEATELRDRYARSSSMAREATQAAAAREEIAASISRAARAVSEVAAPRPTAASSETEQKKVRIESTQQRSVQEQGSSTTIKKSEDCNCGCDSEVFASAKSKTAKMAKEKNGSRKGDI